MQFTLLGMRASVLKGDRPRAARLLREALSWSDQCGFRRSLVDGGEPVLELVAQLDSSDQRLMAVAREVLRIAGRRPSQTAPAPEVDAPVEALNARETEILRLVEQGMMNKQIASELGLTVGTVKWYMQQIFSKLAVRRRSQAIHKARVLGFIR
jgi:DNA-binding NarL/FixJ family response regulator